MSGVNIVVKSPYHSTSLLACVRHPLRVFSKEHALHIVYVSALKVLLCKKLFIFFSLRQHLWRLWEAQMEVAAVTLNQKVVDKFLKVCAEGEGAHQGA